MSVTLIDHPAVIRYAYSFAASTGAEVEDLLQDARIAYLIAERDTRPGGHYDPHKSSFNTFATNCIFREMCSVAGRHKRRNPNTYEMSDEIQDNQPSAERGLMLAELIKELPEDAQACVQLVFNNDLGEGTTAYRIKTYIRRKLGFTVERADQAFRTIAEALEAF